MLVLVATTDTQGDRSDDYCHTVEGELVQLPVLDSDREFVGLASRRGTTTCVVADIDVDEATLRAAIGDSVDLHLAVARLLGEGTVLETRDGQLSPRESSPREMSLATMTVGLS